MAAMTSAQRQQFQREMAPVGFTLAAIMTGGTAIAVVEAVGVGTAAAFVANELKDEVLSQATGGASDVFDITKAGKKLFKGARKSLNKLLGKNNDPVKALMETSKKGDRTMGRSTIFEREGGFEQANIEFDALNPTDIKTLDDGTRVGTISDGRTAIVRPVSKGTNKPTLEIQKGKNKKKFRLNNEKVDSN